jgi:hypothetical protein
MSPGRSNLHLLIAAGAALIVLAGASTVALAAGGGAFRHWASPSR